MAFDPTFLKMQWDAKSISEGQSVIYSIMELLNFALHRDDNGEDLMIVLDEIDSGLSIDNVDVVMRKIKRIVKRGDTQFIFSFNQPRVLKWFPHVLSMYDGTKLTLHTDDDMMQEIRKHKKSFDRVRKTSKGMPKVYE
jgi:Fe-S cluster assembly ATPase SufC